MAPGGACEPRPGAAGRSPERSRRGSRTHQRSDPERANSLRRVKKDMTVDNKTLKFGIPKGSLEAQTLELMRKSGWRISVGGRSYIPTVDDRSLSCRLLRPQEMPRYIADGTLDAGITGSD